MKPAGIDIFHKRTDIKGYTTTQRNLTLSIEYENKIKVNENAWSFFNILAPSYKRESVWWIMSAKKEETQLRRLDILISSSESGLKIPMLRKKK
jgi:uncharacterized protein YdeI (YjbR/CyaY-like superfamily)